jgi:DNA modification methylase
MKRDGIDMRGFSSNWYKQKFISSYQLTDTWKKVKGGWEHSLHKICSRTGCFPPALARYFIWKFSKPKDKVLDMFSGKGTTTLEACLTGRIGIGVDAAPDAYVLTHSKVKPVSATIFEKYLKLLTRKMRKNICIDEVNEDVRIFYHPDTLKQIVALKKMLIDDNSDEGIFTKALMCGILHGSSDTSLSLRCSHSFSMAPRYVRRYKKEYKLRPPRRQVISCLRKKAKEVLANELPKVKGKAYNTSAEKLPLKDESIDLIVTSPPYLRSQTYAWDNWLRLWFLGYDYKEVAKNMFHTESKEKYAKFMGRCLEEMYRVLKNNSACFLVMGDATVKGKKIKTAELVVEHAESTGFRIKRIINDRVDRKYFTFIPKSRKMRIDRILELHKGKPRESKIKVRWVPIV